MEESVLYLNKELQSSLVLEKIHKEKLLNHISEIKDMDKPNNLPPFIKEAPCLVLGNSTFIVGMEEIYEYLLKRNL